MPNQQKLQPNTAEPSTTPIANLGALGQSLFASMPTGVIIFDRDLKIIKANPAAAKLIKLTDYIDESLSKNLTDPPASQPDWTSQLKSTFSTEQPLCLGVINHSSPQTNKTKMLQISSLTHQPADQSQNSLAILLIEDITEQFDIKNQLAESQRWASIGRLSAKVAHELNNPMDGILRYLNLAARALDRKKNEKLPDYIAHCRQGIMRMVRIVSELLEFSRGTYALSEEYIRIDLLIEDAIKAMDSRPNASMIQISRNFTPSLPKIKSGNLFGVFCNLIKNAFDAMPEGGQLTISTRLTEDNKIAIKFSDTGPGLPTENPDAIFEPFFTTKAKGKGTGLGLAICKDIVNRYHGRITAKNNPQGGSIFTIYLPAPGKH